MKIPLLLSGALLLTGCETLVVDSGPHYHQPVAVYGETRTVYVEKKGKKKKEYYSSKPKYTEKVVYDKYGRVKKVEVYTTDSSKKKKKKK